MTDVDLTVQCGRCKGLTHFDVNGKVVLPCDCCPDCEGRTWVNGSTCFRCAGTGRRLAGSEDITAVERKTPAPVIVRPVTTKRRPR